MNCRHLSWRCGLWVDHFTRAVLKCYCRLPRFRHALADRIFTFGAIGAARTCTGGNIGLEIPTWTRQAMASSRCWCEITGGAARTENHAVVQFVRAAVVAALRADAAHRRAEGRLAHNRGRFALAIDAGPLAVDDVFLRRMRA